MNLSSKIRCEWHSLAYAWFVIIFSMWGQQRLSHLTEWLLWHRLQKCLMMVMVVRSLCFATGRVEFLKLLILMYLIIIFISPGCNLPWYHTLPFNQNVQCFVFSCFQFDLLSVSLSTYLSLSSFQAAVEGLDYAVLKSARQPASHW